MPLRDLGQGRIPVWVAMDTADSMMSKIFDVAA